MEADAIINMVEDAFHQCCFIIYFIVSDDDSKIRALLKYPSRGVWGQVLKSSKGKIDKEIPVPSLLADPSYRAKFTAKHIFYIVNDVKAQQCGCTRVDALRLKKDWGYTIKNNRGN